MKIYNNLEWSTIHYYSVIYLFIFLIKMWNDGINVNIYICASIILIKYLNMYLIIIFYFFLHLKNL